LDSGSDIEAASGDIVRAMGLGDKLRERATADRQRVRGVGTAEGEGVYCLRGLRVGRGQRIASCVFLGF
jgi:hypothetical protein